MYSEPQQNIKGFTPTPMRVLCTFCRYLSSFYNTYRFAVLGIELQTPHAKPHQHRCLGFTLVEIMVSVSIFIIVMFVSVGSLLMLVRASAVAFESQSVTDNLSFVMDNITRNLRTGYDFYCSGRTDSLHDGLTNDCSSGGVQVAFTDGETGKRTAIRLSTSSGIERKTEDDGNKWTSITSTANVTIDNLRFVVTGTTQGDNAQPRVVIMLTGRDADGVAQPFRLQSTIVQRVLDF